MDKCKESSYIVMYEIETSKLGALTYMKRALTYIYKMY